MSISLVTRMKILLGGYKLAKKQKTLKTYSDMVKSIEVGTANKPIEEKAAKGLVDYLQKMELKAARKQLATAKAMAKMPYDWGLDEEKYNRACLNAAKKNGLDSREYEKARDAYKNYTDGIAGNFRETRKNIAENKKTIDAKVKEAGVYALLAFDVSSRLSTLAECPVPFVWAMFFGFSKRSRARVGACPGPRAVGYGCTDGAIC